MNQSISKYFKRWLAVLTLVVSIPLGLRAYKVEIDGLYYELSYSKAEVTYQNTSSTNYSNLSGVIEIPEEVLWEGHQYTVTSIGKEAFRCATNLTGVEIPYTITAISTSAFYGCKSISSITIPEAISLIGENAFGDCTSLTSLTFNAINCSSCGSSYDAAFPNTIETLSIGSGVKQIPSNFLYDGSQIESVIFPNTLTDIGRYAFRYSEKLTAAEIPEAVTWIGDGAFYGCTALTSLTFYATNCSSSGSSGYPAFPSSISTLTIGDDVAKIPDYFLSNGSQIESVVFPKALTEIGRDAFRYNHELATVEIPEAVTRIGNNAFSGCSALTFLRFNAVDCEICGSSGYYAFPSSISSLTIGSGVTKIPGYFLGGGSKIESVVFPNTLTKIGNYSFGDNRKCQSFIIPASVKYVESNAFSGCSGLVKSAYPSNLSNPFSYGTAIQYPANCIIDTNNVIYNSNASEIFFAPLSLSDEYSIPETVTAIRGKSFQGCKLLSSVIIPESITSIGDYAFEGCTSLISLTFNATNCTICSSSAFPSSLTTLTVGNGVTQIPSDLLYNGSQIESIILPNSVTSVGSYAFLNSNNLKSLTIGSGLLLIGTRAFSYKNSYSSDYYKLTIPKVFWLGNTPPANVGEISASVNYVANDKYSFSNQVKYQFLSSKFLVNGTWYVPVSPSDRTCDVVDCEYSLSNCEVTIPEKVNNRGVELSVLNINNYSYYKNNTITSLSASNNGNLGDYSFYECKALTSVIANNAGSIGNDAFYNCGNLNNVELGNSLTTIGDYAFSKCTALPAITLPNNVTSIGERIFRDCSQLATVDIGTGIASIPGHSFAYCSSLNNLVIPKNVMNIGDYVFSGCRSLANFTMEDGDETLQIGSNGSSPLFYDCPLDVVYIGRKLSYKTASNYGYSPFYRNTSLRSVEVTDAETQIYDNEFYGCTNLKTLKIGNGVEAIGKWAFSGCSSLDYFSAGYHVETIGEEAFSDCTGLTSYYSFSILPPVCGNQALDDINKWDCTLFVPAESSDEYMAADQWKDFFFVNENDAVLIENICINVESLNGETGDTFQLTADIFPGNATRKRIDWSSSDPTIVKVDADGLATFVMEGYATITARATDGSGVEASIDVVVTVKEPELGDSNANGRINIADAVNTANYAIGNEVEHFNATAADVNKDGIITLADASATITLVLEQEVPDVAAGVRAIARAAEINSGRFYIDEAYIEPGESKTLAFNLDNEVQYYGFQADITLPKGVVVEDEDGLPAVELSSRTNSSYSVVTNPVSSSLIRVGAFSTSHAPIEGDSGALMYLNVVADDEFDGGVLSVTDIRFVNNADVDVPFPAFSVEMRNNAVNRCYLPDFSISAGQTKTVSLMLDNETPFTAFQADIYLPAGMNIVADSFKVGSRAANHSVSAKSFSDGRTRLICSSPDNSLFSGDEGAILEFEVNVNPEFDGTCVIELRNQVCSTANAKEYVLANSTTSVTVINDIVTGLDGYRLSDISVMVIGSRIIIKGLPDGVIANLYNLCGALVNSAIGNGAAVSMDVAPSGVYILRIGSDAMKIAVP